jgi:hypothetical protein
MKFGFHVLGVTMGIELLRYVVHSDPVRPIVESTAVGGIPDYMR